MIDRKRGVVLWPEGAIGRRRAGRSGLQRQAQRPDHAAVRPAPTPARHVDGRRSADDRRPDRLSFDALVEGRGL
jgi:hypothetical protein